ncbi:MAG: outer membrane beta-barrel family protein, partial [Muribaculaceae bacterium]|nr:outer membrane beta-barrel family protein [Muribaculaceae bacterium]
MKLFPVLFMLVFPLCVCAAAQNDSISKQEQSIKNLDEVLVKATKTMTMFDSDGMVTTIAGTPLQTLETAYDILGYIPGIISNNGTIEVVGKGKPAIYINGRKIINQSELCKILATKVKTIKVINNPGARYGGKINAVIRISTIRELGEGFSLDNRMTMGYRNFIYGKDVLNLNYRNYGVDVFFIGEYDNVKSSGSSIVAQDVWSQIRQFSEMNILASKRTQVLDGKIGFNYSSISNHSFGVYYQNIYKPNIEKTDNSSIVSTDGFPPSKSNITNSNIDRNYDNLVDAYYSGNFRRWTVDATFNLLWKKANNRQIIIDNHNDRQPNVFYLDNNNHGRMVAADLHLSTSIWHGKLEMGMEYTDTKRKDLLVGSVPDINGCNNQIKENTMGVYGQLLHNFGNIVAQAGIRYEYTESRFNEYDKKNIQQSATYNKIQPSVSFVIPVGKKMMFQLAYSRRYSRPLYSQLSNTISYINQYTYETGNPELRSASIDNFTLNFKLKWLTIMASYKHVHDGIITACSDFQSNSKVTLLHKENSKNDLDKIEITASLIPGFIGNFYYPVAMVGLASQFYDITYRESVRHMNNPMAIIRVNNMFRMPNNFMINANFSFISDFDSENIHMGQTWQIDLSVSKTFNRHWDMRLTLNDVFNTANKSVSVIY